VAAVHGSAGIGERLARLNRQRSMRRRNCVSLAAVRTPLLLLLSIRPSSFGRDGRAVYSRCAALRMHAYRKDTVLRTARQVVLRRLRYTPRAELPLSGTQYFHG
jgi:hypothetical protein